MSAPDLFDDLAKSLAPAVDGFYSRSVEVLASHGFVPPFRINMRSLRVSVVDADQQNHTWCQVLEDSQECRIHLKLRLVTRITDDAVSSLLTASATGAIDPKHTAPVHIFSCDVAQASQACGRALYGDRDQVAASAAARVSKLLLEQAKGFDAHTFAQKVVNNLAF